MKTPTTLTRHDIEMLRSKGPGTNGKSVSATPQEIDVMKKHLETLYTGNVQYSFSEKIVLRNKEY